MKAIVKEATAYLNGELVATGSVRQLSMLTGVALKIVENHLRDGGATLTGYTFRYTGREIPRPVYDDEVLARHHMKAAPKRRRKPTHDLAKVEAMARAAGMHYGTFVGLTGI